MHVEALHNSWVPHVVNRQPKVVKTDFEVLERRCDRAILQDVSGHSRRLGVGSVSGLVIVLAEKLASVSLEASF